MDPPWTASNRRIRRTQAGMGEDAVLKVLVGVVFFLLGYLLWVHFVGFYPK